MQIITYIPILHLQLFAEGGAGAAGDGGAGQGTGVTGAAAVSQKGAKGTPIANVVYGKQESAPAAEVHEEPQTQPEAVDLEAEFEDLIKGEYKSPFQNKVQNIVRERVKSSNEIVEKYSTLMPALELLAGKHGVDVNDATALAKAIEDDDSLYEEAALENGRTATEEKKFSKLERQNKRLLQQINDRNQREQADRQMAVWEQQASEARKTYPNLDLNVEAKNLKFRQLLGAGVDVGTAYFAIHKDDILSGAMHHTAQKVAEKITNNIISGNKRPAENGMSSQSAAVTKIDPSLMTREQRRALIKRSAGGETIRF